MTFVNATERAFPVFGQSLKGGTGGDTVIGVAFCGVVLVAAYVTDVLFHTNEFYLGKYKVVCL